MTAPELHLASPVGGRRSTWPRVEGLAMPCPPRSRRDAEDGLRLVIALDCPSTPCLVAEGEPDGLRVTVLAPEGRKWVLVDRDTSLAGEAFLGSPADVDVCPLIPWKSLRAALALQPDEEV